MPNIFKDGGGAGIGSYVVVFKDGQLAENTDLAKVRGAYESGDSIFISIIDEGTEDALVPASGWIDEEAKLHLVARDFDDNKTYSLELGSDPTEPIEAKVEDGIEAGGEPLGGAVKAEDGALLIDEIVQPVGPVPVAVIDGVEYFHKQEFNISNFEGQHAYDILTGEDLGKVSGPIPKYPCLFNGIYSGGVQLKDYINIDIYINSSDFTSRSFTVVDTLEEVTDNTKICLPTCSAYYGFLSEDGKTFISYYNLKGEGPAVVAPVTKIKDASNHEVEIHDARMPMPAEGDAGKVVKVSEALGFELGEGGGSGGTQLYKHEFTLSKPHPQGAGTINLSISIVSLSPTPITNISSMYGSYFFVHDGYLIKNMIYIDTPSSFGFVRSGPGSTGYVISYIDFDNQTIAANWIDADTTISASDTVTPL